MKKLFNHILVPVHFNRNTAMLIEKAIQVANRFTCDIHLLYVQTPVLTIPYVYDGHFPGTMSAESYEESASKLKNLLDEYRSHLDDGLLMTSAIAMGSWHLMIKEQVITKHIDLVVWPRNERKTFSSGFSNLDVNLLSQQTQCPVLTVTQDFDADHLQNIVVPVDDFLPIRKLTAATYLARHFNAVIHLMGGRSASFVYDKQKARCLTRSYQLLRDYTNVKVHCSTQQGHAIAEDTLAYAKNVNADLIVVNTGKESILKGWFNRWMRNYLYKQSDIPVLTIAPQI